MMKTLMSLPMLVAVLPACTSAPVYHDGDAAHAADHLAEGLPLPSGSLRDAPALDPNDLPIVGQAPWRYKYEPLKLQMPANSNPPYSHGLEVDADANLYLTYYDKGDPMRCLLKWSPADGYEKFTVVGHGSEMCQIGNGNTGPHGLRISKDTSGKEVFYMANNNQALFKTTLEGEVLWSVYNRPTEDVSKQKKNNATHCAFGAPTGYCPTWFEHQPGSEYLYMTDGYGSNKMYIYTVDGKYTGTSVGGTGGPDQHGKFNIAHSISWDPRRSQMAVSDRVNHRLEYFDVDAKDPSKFDYVSTTMQDFAGNNTGLVCNVRFLNDTWAITPTLEGPVFIMDKENKLLSTVSYRGFLKPPVRVQD